MTTFFFVRHGETSFAATDRKHGVEFDISMTKRGFAQIAQAAETIEVLGVHHIVSSPLLRATQAAKHLATRLSLPEPEVSTAFAERSFGAAEGLTRWEVEERWPNRAAIPGYTSDAEVVRRAARELTAIAAVHPTSRVLIVTHAGVIKALARFALGDANAMPSGSVAPGGIWAFRLEAGSGLMCQGEVRQ